jgi:hypothetical protein
MAETLELVQETAEKKRKVDMLEPVNESAMASFLAFQRRKVEAWRRERGEKGLHWVEVKGDVTLTRQGAIACALDLGHGISVKNTISWPYAARDGVRLMMRGVCPNNRIVKAVRLSDGLLVVARVRNPLDYPNGGEFMAIACDDGTYLTQGTFDRRGW